MILKIICLAETFQNCNPIILSQSPRHLRVRSARDETGERGRVIRGIPQQPLVNCELVKVVNIFPNRKKNCVYKIFLR